MIVAYGRHGRSAVQKYTQEGNEKMKKSVLMILSLVMIAVIALTGTLAYLTDTEEAVNVMTMGKVDIEQHEYERALNADGSYKIETIGGADSYVLKGFTQGKPLLPATEVDANSNPYNFGAGDYDPNTKVKMSQVGSHGSMDVFVSKSAQDKFVTVENTGKTDAFVRTIIAFEIGSLTEAEFDEVIRSSSFMTDQGVWKVTDIGIADINGSNFYISEYIYNGAKALGGVHENGVLPAGETTYPSLAQVYMTGSATNEDVEAIDGNKNGTYDILVLSQAVQADGFENAKTALDTAFGVISTTNHPWTGKAPVIPQVITTAEELAEVLNDVSDAKSGNNTVYLADDIDLSDTEWTPVSVDGYHGAGVVTLEGNGHTITGLKAPLFAGGFAGKSGIIIKNLTIADSEIKSSSTQGAGAFIECVDSMETIILENCHLLNSTVDAPNARTGGLVGWTSGYSNQNDGPVKTYVTISDCSVIGCKITGTAVGGINGHAGASDWTYTTIKNCRVIDNELISYDDGGWRVGEVVGTANVGELTILNTVHGGNTMTQAAASSQRADGLSTLVGRFVPGSTGKLVIDGVTPAAGNDEDFKDELTADKENIVIELTGDVSYDIAAWKNSAMGGNSTKSIVINGNGHTITFDQTDSDWTNIVTNGAKLVINDAVITNSGYDATSGTWNAHDISFNCEVELNNVTALNAISLEDNAVFNKVTITDDSTDDAYMLWITAEGQKVELYDCVIDATGTEGNDRGIKIDTQYVDTPAKVTLVVKNTKFTTEKKAAILVKSSAGADITLENVDISGVAADTVNPVWVDSEAAAYADKVVVTGGSCIVEH